MIDSTALHKMLTDLYTRRLEDFRKNNDRNLSEYETAKLRGKISEIKKFLSYLEDEKKLRDDLAPRNQTLS